GRHFVTAVPQNNEVILCRGRASARPTLHPLSSDPWPYPSILGLAVQETRLSHATVLGIQSLAICLFVVASPLDVRAQSASTGALTGTITDPAGAVLQNAQIALRNKGTGATRTAITDQDGSYRLSLLPPGQYELTVEAVGFVPLVVRG